MTQAEWEDSDDAGAMLDFVWRRRGVAPHWMDTRFGGDVSNPNAVARDKDCLVDSLYRYYLVSCRGVWGLLPQEASRHGVELAERFIAGAATAEEVSAANWDTEGAAFYIDYNSASEEIARWVQEVLAIPADELCSMLHMPGAAIEIEPQELLRRAAYFADYAMVYPSLSPQGPPPENFRLFLSAAVLRQHVGYPA